MSQQRPVVYVTESTSSHLTSPSTCTSASSSSTSVSSDDSPFPRSQSQLRNNLSSRQNIFSKKQESLSWTTEDEYIDDIDQPDEDEESGSNFNEDSEEDESHQRVDVTRTRTPPVPVLIARQQQQQPKPEAQPLRTQVRLLIERALIIQIQENRAPNPRRPWIRRQIDIFLLRVLVFIMRYHRELCILFLLFASGLASLRTSPVKTRSTPTPKPFFDGPQNLKYIEDFYKGEYVDLVQSKITLGPAFVFYYAPWDSESIAARNVFVKVARYFHNTVPNRIRFYAVNCWWPQGECRRNYKNLSHFPIFVAHVEKNAGIIYSGPIRAELIIKFLNSILKPLTRIDTEEEIWRFRAQHDAIMLGYFNFTEPESVRAYETYLQMALRNFEADPFGQVGFGIFLKPELAQKYFLTSSNVISLVLFNEIHTAKWTGDKETQGVRGPVGQVANWVMERTRKTPITWAYQIRAGFANRPVALGPMDLVDELSKGPVMLLITRRYYPSSYSPFYAQVKEVALDYFNCNKSGNVTRLRKTTHKINSEWMTLWNSVSKICSTQLPVSHTCAILKDQLAHWESKKNSLKRESLANYEGITERMNFTGFSCASDRQFKFFAIDPVDMPYFVELGFGGLGFHNDSDPVLFIIDAQNDMILPFSKFNISEIAEVIYNYTNEMENSEEEERTFISTFWNDPSVHFQSPQYKESESSPLKEKEGYSFVKTLVGGGNDGSASSSSKPTEVETDYFYEQFQLSQDKRQNLVLRISSSDLNKYLRGQEPFHLPNPMFVMYSAKFCGVCGVSLASFIELSRFMSDYYDVVGNITFAKLNMIQNSLPAALTPDRLPTFVYFPGTDRTNIRMFPADEKITSKTLLRFLLAEMDPDTRIKLSLQSPGCNEGDQYCYSNYKSKSNDAEDARRIKRLQANCLAQSQVNNFTSSPRDSCISMNKISVTDKLQHIFNEIQHGYYSHPQPDVEAELGVNIDTLKTQDLDHLRSMKITLDVT